VVEDLIDAALRVLQFDPFVRVAVSEHLAALPEEVAGLGQPD